MNIHEPSVYVMVICAVATIETRVVMHLWMARGVGGRADFRAEPKSIPTNLQIKLCLRDLDAVGLIKMYGHDPSHVSITNGDFGDFIVG